LFIIVDLCTEFIQCIVLFSHECVKIVYKALNDSCGKKNKRIVKNSAMDTQWVSYVREYCAKHTVLYQYCDDLQQFQALPGLQGECGLQGLASNRQASAVDISKSLEACLPAMLRAIAVQYNFVPRILHAQVTVVNDMNKYHMGRDADVCLREGDYNITLYCK